MGKRSFILQALSLLGPEEILNLCEVVAEKQVQLKKAAGEDLLVWHDPVSKKKSLPKEEAKVLDFPKKRQITDFQEIEDPYRPGPPAPEESEMPSLLNADMVLWQREVSKETEGALKRVDAFKGYQKSTQMYVVKTESPEGKQKIRFASTDGILVNKKQS